MTNKQRFINWLRQSENPDNIILAALLEQGIIGMPDQEEKEDDGQ